MQVDALSGPSAHFEAPESFDAMAYLAHGVATLPRAISVIVLLVVALVAIAVISFATPWLGLDASVFQALIPGGRA